jgi:hypothetical protein
MVWRQLFGAGGSCRRNLFKLLPPYHIRKIWGGSSRRTGSRSYQTAATTGSYPSYRQVRHSRRIPSARAEYPALKSWSCTASRWLLVRGKPRASGTGASWTVIKKYAAVTAHFFSAHFAGLIKKFESCVTFFAFLGFMSMREL